MRMRMHVHVLGSSKVLTGEASLACESVRHEGGVGSAGEWGLATGLTICTCQTEDVHMGQAASWLVTLVVSGFRVYQSCQDE
jgi:hypothetical protein